MNMFPIDNERFTQSIKAVLGVEPSVDYKTGERRLNRDNVPQWTVSLAMAPEGARPSIAEISIASHADLDIEPGVLPMFENLQVLHWKSNKGGRSSSGVMLMADGVSSAVAA